MKNKNLGIVVALVAIAIIGGSIISYQQFQQQTTQTATQEITVTNSENTKIRGQNDLSLLDYGDEVSPDMARSVTGFTDASTPSSIMGNLALKSVRVRDYAESYLMTAFYVPSPVTLQDHDTFDSVMKSGGVIVIFTEEKPSSTYDPQKWRDDFVKTAPQVRKTDTINAHPAVVITGNPDKDIKSEVLIYKNNLQIDVVSVKHNAGELIGVAQLITKG